jgi:hypothetical protein
MSIKYDVYNKLVFYHLGQPLFILLLHPAHPPRVHYLNGEECELRSANSAYQPVKYPVDEINIIEKFVQVLEHK